jgi:Flp pilus assembly protein TadD
VKVRTETAQRFEEQGNFLDAIVEYHGVARLDSENPDAHYRLARLYVRDRKLDEARRKIQAALDLDSNNGTYRALLDEINRISRRP